MSQTPSPQPAPTPPAQITPSAQASQPAPAPQATPATPLPAQAQARQPTTPIAPPPHILNFATPAPVPPQTFREKLRAGDAHWPWQLGLRAITILVGIIGIGCTAWAVSKYTHNTYDFLYDLEDSWSIPWGLITFTISVIWSAICILVFLLRHTNRPVHPGVRVGIDLILWLAFIPTAMFAVVAVMSVVDWGQDGSLGYYYSSYGYYQYIPSNGTWVWEASDDSYYSNQPRDCSGSSSYYSTSDFSTCAEQDAYVNELWRGKNLRFNIELTSCVCQFISLVAHLALFVFACVDTHYRNSRKVSKEAEQLAADIVMNMVRTGAIIQPPGAAQMRPMAPQMMSMAPQMMPPQQMPIYPPQRSPLRPYPTPPQQAAASSSNEKSAGPRYA
ncbi:hypothetical protein BU26DRAFT_549582 [Trematosphaeria pertusa]|uniref:Uncharacterized protein n=1 Tax=Trematosphaeria pertusa TaxID=390896 RepID=A0A6A6IK40_9PLEO|nr:uncharacterized protein BU26DRAFT_549582 [Trematosphaeria pertusa]KAF2250954.1 hypothetical protein BU26DRAFT_549582 [Trematosphaeria pertusa]